MRAALYARYSADNQRDASIADQMRVCRAFGERQGWTVAQEYADYAVSGATLLRSGFQALMRDALAGHYRTKVTQLAEALQRPDTRMEATEMLRGLIDQIVLIPQEGQADGRAGTPGRASEPRLRIELRGNLAAMLGAAVQAKRRSDTDGLHLQMKMVAGVRNQRYLQLWWVAA